jgi:hypothetical protein
LRIDKLILIKFYTGKFHEELSNHISFNLDWITLMTTLYNSTNIYLSRPRTADDIYLGYYGYLGKENQTPAAT